MRRTESSNRKTQNRRNHFATAGRLLPLMLAGALAGCGSAEIEPLSSDADEIRDRSAPVLVVAQPAAGETVSGTVAVTGTASDVSGISWVEVDPGTGIWQRASGSTSWSYAFDSQGTANGPLTLRVRARDVRGNMAQTSVAVVVQNASCPGGSCGSQETCGDGTCSSSESCASCAADCPCGSSVLIPAGASWRYLDDGSDQGSAWISTGFADGAWKSGRAQLGYGEGDEATVLSYGSSSTSKFVTTYLRSSFSVADPASARSGTLRLLIDDGAIVYLNGSELLRANMPAGSVSAATLASDTPCETCWTEYQVSLAALRAGTNVLAVEVHQAYASSSDVSFDLELKTASGSAGSCGDGSCASSETCSTCPADCGSCAAACGDGSCNGAETCSSCPADCGSCAPACGDGSCNGAETCSSCPADCGSCTAACGDGSCNGTETCSSCSSDCGACPAGGDPIYVGAGDITATDWMDGARSTAALLDSIFASNPNGLIFSTGDSQQEDGSYANYMNSFDLTWGRHKARIRPTPGNHEFDTDHTGSGYFQYWGSVAGTKPNGWYSFDLGEWHIVVLNTNCSYLPDGCGAGSTQEKWLRADLAAHPNRCTLAQMHRPRFSSGAVHGSSTTPQALWQALYDHGAEVVLSGHDHIYERFAPQTPAGVRDDVKGIRQFLVGVGGYGLYDYGTIKPNSEVRGNSTYGVLKLTLHPTSYDWQFVPATGGGFTDSGTTACHFSGGSTCAPETDSAFCARLGKNCGSVTAADNCGTSRTVACGGCTAPQTCGGAGVANVCGGGGGSSSSSIDNPYRGGAKWCRTAVHTHPAKLGGTSLLDAYRAAGFDVMFFTNHDYDGMSTAPAAPGLTVSQGLEVSGPSHHNALGIKTFIDSSSFQQTIDAAAAQGGLVQINHPSRDGITKAQVDALRGLWGIEVKNEPQNAPSDVVLWDGQLSQRKKIWGTFSDDAHDTSDVGKGWLMVNTPADCSEAAVLASMKVGNFYDTEGPKLTVTVSGSTISVTSDTGAKIDWYKQNVTLIKTTSGASGSYTVDGSETFVRVVVTDSSGRAAWSMPLFVGASTSTTPPTTPTTPTTTSGKIEVQYAASAEDLANPERGFMRQLSVYPDATGSISMSRQSATDSLVWIYFRLDNYRSRDLDAAGLDRIRAAFDAARSAGLKVVARFIYNFPSSYSSDPSAWEPDAPLSRVLAHISQLKPVLAASSDVLAVLQAGFVGLWGEWHSSANGLTAPASQKAILDALAAAVPAERMLQVRYPKDKNALYGGPLTEAEAFSTSTLARIGHHNDCFLASSDDEGTYRSDLYATPSAATIQGWKDFIGQEGLFTPVGGETCAVNAPRSQCATATAELESMRWSFLNNGFNTDVLASWTSGGCMDTIRRRLGYRLVMAKALVPAALPPGSAFDVEVQVKNEGYGSLYNPRPFYLLIERGGVRHAARIDGIDPRRWQPGQTYTVKARARLPATLASGTYRLGVWMPDAASGLRSRPEYAVRLANQGVWDATIGFNVLTSSLTVDASAAGLADPSAPELSSANAP